MAGRGIGDGTMRLAQVASVLAGFFAVALGLVAQANQDPGQNGLDPRSTGLVALLAVPAVIGWLGALSGHRVLLIAAGILCLLQSVIAFSGVTLIFLIPALLFLRASVADGGATRPPIRPSRVAIMVLLAVPIVLVVIRFTGLAGILLLVAIGGVAAAFDRRDGAQLRPGGRDALIGLVVTGLAIGAWIAWLGTLQGGSPTVAGSALAAILVLAALGVAAASATKRGTPQA